MVARRPLPHPDNAPQEADSPSDLAALRQTLKERTREVEALQQRLAEIEEAGGRFLSAAAHEVKTPLTIIQSYLEIILSDLTEGLSEEQLSFLHIVYDSVLRLRHLILDMVDLSAFETGNLQLDLAPVEIEPLVDEVMEETRAIADRSGLGLAAEVASGLPAVMVDAGRMREVLRRLLDNAVKFTPAGGHLGLKARADADTVVLEVEDDGVGIPQGRIDEIFHAFAQLHREPGERRQGSGLGLAVCRRLVHAFGGTLEVESTLGEGSTFIIRLPAWRGES